MFSVSDVKNLYYCNNTRFDFRILIRSVKLYKGWWKLNGDEKMINKAMKSNKKIKNHEKEKMCKNDHESRFITLELVG